MTIIRRDGFESPFSDWIRNEPRLDSIKERLSLTDVDYWIHQYRAKTDKVGDRFIDSIMCVELKTFQRNLPFAQRDTLRIVSAVTKQAFRTKDGKVRTIKVDLGNEVRHVRHFGYFMLRLHGDRPDNSEWIEWHGRSVDIDKLVDILRFKINPITLKTRSDRRHHKPSKNQSQRDLFIVSQHQ